MTHIVEKAKSGRSKCRGCGQTLAKDELRFGEVMPNPFADDSDMTLWFHITCGAMRRPASFEDVLSHELIGPAAILEELVAQGNEHYRLDRIAGVEKAPSGRARCRHCRETITRDVWRIPLVFFEEGMFNSSGFIHVSCSGEYFGTTDILARLQHFGGELHDADLAELKSLLG